MDADALTLLSQHPNLHKAAQQQSTLILTLHPAEAARLQAAQQIVEKFNAYVVLKGHQTIVASPNGRLYINAGLATAGSDDVLSGIIGSLLV